jgi:hypothetical protein
MGMGRLFSLRAEPEYSYIILVALSWQGLYIHANTLSLRAHPTNRGMEPFWMRLQGQSQAQADSAVFSSLMLRGPIFFSNFFIVAGRWVMLTRDDHQRASAHATYPSYKARVRHLLGGENRAPRNR